MSVKDMKVGWIARPKKHQANKQTNTRSKTFH